MTEKRFTIIYNEHSEMMQYVDNQKEEPNRWAIWNASETAQKLNELNDENKELIQFKEQVFNLIDKKLEENEKEWNGVDTAMYYANKGTLNELKKELSE